MRRLAGFASFLLAFPHLASAQETYPAIEPGEEEIATDESFGFVMHGGASFVTVKPGAKGGELSFSLLYRPIEERNLWVGPRAGILVAESPAVTRVDFNLGVEGTLWFLNAFGPGIGVDFIGPSSPEGARGRGEAFFSTRFARYEDVGAWAIRIGAIYDTHYEWGGRLGVTLQWDGASSLEQPSAENGAPDPSQP